MARIIYKSKNLDIETRRKLFGLDDMRDLRKAIGKNQCEFWSAVGVSQTAGSRYESGRDVPVQVLDLICLYWVEGIDFVSLQRSDVSDRCLINWEEK